MNSVGVCGAGDVCAVVDEQARVCAACDGGAAHSQIKECACCEILFAELDE